jgi:hypothetical protein
MIDSASINNQNTDKNISVDLSSINNNIKSSDSEQTNEVEEKDMTTINGDTMENKSNILDRLQNINNKKNSDDLSDSSDSSDSSDDDDNDDDYDDYDDDDGEDKICPKCKHSFVTYSGSTYCPDCR